MKNYKGFSIVEILLVFAVLAVIGTVGYLFFNNVIAPKVSNDASVSVEPVKVNNAKDLETVNTELEKISVDDSELNQLDSAINSF